MDIREHLVNCVNELLKVRAIAPEQALLLVDGIGKSDKEAFLAVTKLLEGYADSALVAA